MGECLFEKEKMVKRWKACFFPRFLRRCSIGITSRLTTAFECYEPVIAAKRSERREPYFLADLLKKLAGSFKWPKTSLQLDELPLPPKFQLTSSESLESWRDPDTACQIYIYIYKPYVNQICSVSYIHYTNNIHNQGELVDNSGGFIYIYIIPI